MKKFSGLFLFVMLSFLFIFACNDNQTLFQENSNNWEEYGNARWTFTNAVLIGKVTDEEGFLMTNTRYKDFKLELEFKPDSTINSGVFIRCMNKELSATDCHEINIWDLHANQDFRTGSIVTKEKPKLNIQTLNTWNTYRIEASKSQITVWLNSELTAESKYDYPIEGYIALQAAGTGTIQFRNILITKQH